MIHKAFIAEEYQFGYLFNKQGRKRSLSRVRVGCGSDDKGQSSLLPGSATPKIR